MSMKLDGPAKVKKAIEAFSEWLVENCRTKQSYTSVIARYQIQTGHAYRKLQEWLKSLEETGVIRVFANSDVDYIIAKGNVPIETQEETKSRPLHLSPEEHDEIDKIKLRLKMRSGPCKDQECPPFSEEGCEHCTAFRNLKNKSFLEEE